VEGHSDTECSGVPPLEDSLAAHLLPQAAGWAEGRRPLPPLPRDREMLEYLDKIFKLGVQMAAAANNLGVLGVSLIPHQQDTPAPPSEDGSDYSDRCVGQMNNLVHGMATAAGRVMALTTVASRHVWLGLTALAKKDRDDLLHCHGRAFWIDSLGHSALQPPGGGEGSAQPHVAAGSSSGPSARGSASSGGKTEREASASESPENALCLRGPSRGAGSVPTPAGTGRQNPLCSSSGPHSGATTAEGYRVGSSILQELTAAGGSVSAGRGEFSGQDARANPASSLYHPFVVTSSFSNKSDKLYSSLSVSAFHTPTQPRNVVSTVSPLAAQVVTPVKEAASAHARVRVINRAMRVQGHYGRRNRVRKQLMPSLKTPLDVFHCSGENIMAERTLPRECAMLRSKTSVESRPFPCRPPMGKCSLHGTGHQGISQLYCWGPTIDGTSPDTVLQGVETQMHVNGVDGQDAETGLLTRVFQHPSPVCRHKRGKAIISQQRFRPWCENRWCLLCAHGTERRGIILCISWCPRKQMNSGPSWISVV